MASKICWLLLVMLLSVSTFGLSMCCIIIVSVFSSITGILVMTYMEKLVKVKPVRKSSLSSRGRSYSLFEGIPKIAYQMKDSSDLPKVDQRLTGSKEIDDQLRQILSNIVRDFIQTWYQEISLNEEFLDGFNEMCKTIINNFSKSAKEVNWVSFITHQVVESFTSHLRLYRHAETSFRRRQRENPNRNLSIEALFFEKEFNHGENICRENVCCSPEHEMEYLQNVCDTVLYLLLPPEAFDNNLLRKMIREILVSSVLRPLIYQFSDPDEINQNLIYLCKDYIVTSKTLLNVLRKTDNQDELKAFIQISKHEHKVQNAQDAGDKDEIKKYLKSISYIESVAQHRLEKLLGHSKQAENDSTEFYLVSDVTDSPILENKRKLVSLPFDVILNNNIALHYFTQYLVNLNTEGYVFFYHNVEGFRTTVQLMKAENTSIGDESIEKLRVLAIQLYDSYLGPDVSSKITLDENILKKLRSRLKTETINENCFDEVQEKVYESLENEFYLSGFKDSTLYIKLLAELDLLHESSSSGDLDSLSSSKSEEEEKFNCDTVVPTDEEMLNEFLTTEISQCDYVFPEMSSGPLSEDVKELGLLVAEVHSTGITHHAGRTFAVYAISVIHYGLDGSEEKWFVVRRYSEFYDFHEAITNKYPVLSSFNFPSKKPFNNLTRQLMEKRRYMLNEFMQFILSNEILAVCDGLKLMVYNFLQPNMPEKGKKSFIRSVGTFVTPIKTSVKSVGQFARLVPDTFLELKDGFKKAFLKNSIMDNSSEENPTIPKDTRADDIPFRIILLLMDEVFNLRNKDLWFRRRIMTLLRQIIKTMQGGAINRKIKEYVQGLTSTSQIAEWLKTICQSIWPDGHLRNPAAERDYSTKMRTRIVTKMAMISAIPDELKPIIGYETSFKGAMLVFNVFQHPSLNRRLILVIFESFLKILFPHTKIPEILRKLHANSTSLANSPSPSTDRLSEDQQPIQDRPGTPDVRVENAEVKPKDTLREKPIKGPKDTPNEKSTKDSKSKLSFQCLSPNTVSSPKVKKRKKSVESAVFYMDLPKEDDKVILPLDR
ncbi:sorting nexin-13 isoform X3 [Parasteatoda tepidariorum]|uniref:sorting nexin-13 isoform X2 n=1 Tax=Parasteatoda tepidariorum TaxID=114398 RepID=UPI001C720D85|nr:sorting nexin-13 isoform X1 [Parasteatoda tepidariorum]XP_042894784.1 sorting nexin-13 isoform X2 [Parasteatoda tepidariorum]XP_042894785.1 sorting nexin-13 isoform X2 [Parasteatoda tepidariorum]XP_042894786.1 sorting nexin-13 isoform X2 [Parasteatoda tepidariorum]XP_042894787.1 sorting nexin-13 isoform X2 [Parasteatoda tepidariorum]XP_042894788.1 sorting nexin-13 isoform X3 [Parasteatoda tepidariorum]